MNRIARILTLIILTKMHSIYLAIKKYGIPDSTILSVAELNCHEPDCPPTETVITARSIDGTTKNWKIHKPIEEISENDVNDLENNNH